MNTSYLALARRYRPKNFSQVAGQSYIIKILSNALDKNRTHHAFLFIGIRGVGKTTIARILAKCLNCEKKISSKPCGKCNSCKNIDNGTSMDLIEFDAASKTGIDDMRDILDSSNYLPTNSRFKIYLIDEVHMLSKSSFNALLKTLEEPPEHIKFIFATTDSHKLPITILSRCLQFNLLKLSQQEVSDTLEIILKKEKISYEKEALASIAKMSEGSMRDALSILDQAIAYGNNTIITKDINKILGLIDSSILFDLLESILTKNITKVFDLTIHISQSGCYINYILDYLIDSFHKLSVLKLDSSINTFDDYENIQKLLHLTDNIDLQLCYQDIINAKNNIKFIPNEEIVLKMAVMKILNYIDGIEKNTTLDNKKKTIKKT